MTRSFDSHVYQSRKHHICSLRHRSVWAPRRAVVKLAWLSLSATVHQRTVYMVAWWYLFCIVQSWSDSYAVQLRSVCEGHECIVSYSPNAYLVFCVSGLCSYIFTSQSWNTIVLNNVRQLPNATTIRAPRARIQHYWADLESWRENPVIIHDMRTYHR